MAFFNVGDGAAALLDGVEEIAQVPACCGRGVQFDIGLGHILGILLALIDAFEVDRLGFFIERDEVGAHRAGLECAFLSVNEKCPRVVRVRRRAPGAVLPHGIEAIIFECSRLRI